MWKSFKVIDADAHMHEPRDMWDRYVEAKYQDRVPKVAYMDGTFMVYEPDGKIIPKEQVESRPPQTAWNALEEKYGEAYHKWWSPEIRLKDMDRHGWDIQVLLPTGSNGNFGPRAALKDSEIGAALCRAYNNWAYDYCSAAPKRLKFIAVIISTDIDEMLVEGRRAVEKLGAVSLRNILLPKGRWLHEPEYDALWTLASDLDVPIAVHGEYRNQRFQPFRDLVIKEESTGQKTPYHDPMTLRGLNHAMGFPYDNMATLGQFIFTGILERFPKLRLAILESNAGWAPFWLGRMDLHTHGRHSVMGKPEHLSMLPSEYFKRQCTVACDSDEAALKYVVDFLDGNNIVWNTDYPHADGMEPARALPDFDAHPISDEAKRKILWDNAVKLYGRRLVS
jgi:uncharacterized protein